MANTTTLNLHLVKFPGKEVFVLREWGPDDGGRNYKGLVDAGIAANMRPLTSLELDRVVTDPISHKDLSLDFLKFRSVSVAAWQAEGERWTRAPIISSSSDSEGRVIVLTGNMIPEEAIGKIGGIVHIEIPDYFMDGNRMVITKAFTTPTYIANALTVSGKGPTDPKTGMVLGVRDPETKLVAPIPQEILETVEQAVKGAFRSVEINSQHEGITPISRYTESLQRHFASSMYDFLVKVRPEEIFRIREAVVDLREGTAIPSGVVLTRDAK